MKQIVFSLITLFIAAISAGATYFWLSPYRQLYETGPGVIKYSSVDVTDITKSPPVTITLSPSDANKFIDGWAYTGHHEMLSALCHEPAFTVRFYDNSSNELVIESFCASCSNFPIQVRGNRVFQGIDLQSEWGSGVLEVLRSNFPELFKSKKVDEETGKLPNKAFEAIGST